MSEFTEELATPTIPASAIGKAPKTKRSVKFSEVECEIHIGEKTAKVSMKQSRSFNYLLNTSKAAICNLFIF